MKSLCDRWILQFKLCFLLFLYHKFKLCKVLMERLRWCKICSPRLWYQWSEKIVTIFDWVPYALKFALKFACSKLTAPEIYFALHWQAIQRKVLKADCVIRQFSCRSKFLRILLRLFVRGCVWRLRVGLPTKKFLVPTRSFIFFCTNFLLCIKFVILNSQSFTQCNSRRFTSCFADNATAGAEIRSGDASEESGRFFFSNLSQLRRRKVPDLPPHNLIYGHHAMTW